MQKQVVLDPFFFTFEFQVDSTTECMFLQSKLKKPEGPKTPSLYAHAYGQWLYGKRDPIPK